MPKTTPSQEFVEKEDYYTSTGRKVGDFCIGFFGTGIALQIISGVFFLFVTFIFGNNPDQSLIYLTLLLSIIILLALYILGIVIAFKKGRRFIGIGIISTILVPLLLFGACIILFAGLSGGGMF